MSGMFFFHPQKQMLPDSHEPWSFECCFNKRTIQSCAFSKLSLGFLVVGWVLGSRHVPIQPKEPWNKSLNFIFPTKYIISKSLKVGHWLSERMVLHGFGVIQTSWKSLPCSVWIWRVSFLDMLAVISVNLVAKKAPVQSLSTLNSVLWDIFHCFNF